MPVGPFEAGGIWKFIDAVIYKYSGIVQLFSDEVVVPDAGRGCGGDDIRMEAIDCGEAGIGSWSE